LRLHRPGGGILVAAAGLAALFVIWLPVLIGQKVLLGGDVLYEYLPWSAEPSAHSAANPLMSDPVVQGLVWQTVVARDLALGELPLWNQDIAAGTPVLANDQPGVFSPFNWLALPFSPALGLSIAMLAKVLVAGFGMAFFLRTLGVRGLGAALGAVAFASSSFMVDWLAWPHTSVAALTPWLFGLVEAHLLRRRRWALPGLALTICLQFFGGHAETSFHLGLAVALYALVRWLLTGHSWRRLAGLAAAVAVGTLLAGIQLVPFFDLLRNASLIGIRTTSGMGFEHLNLAAITSWVFPNAVGNPGIDGLPGRPPDFNESTGFATVAALVLAPLGAWSAWRRDRSQVIPLLAVALVSAAIVYGLLSPLTGSLPGFQVSNNDRVLVVLCFCVAALGGIGLEALISRPSPAGARTGAWLVVGALGLSLVVATSWLALSRGAAVDAILPRYHNYVGYWLLTGGLALVTAVSFVLAGLGGSRRGWARAGLCALALVEGAFYTATFNPHEPAGEVPPPSPTLTWLQAHAEGRPVIGLGQALVPESAVLYGLRDARAYEILNEQREGAFWSAADPGFTSSRAYMELNQPGTDWLAAAGVGYVVMPTGTALPGTSTAYQAGGVTVAEVPDPRPFAYAASSAVSVRSEDDALIALRKDPLGPVVVEGASPAGGAAQVEVAGRHDGFVELNVVADDAATIVVEQAYQPGWRATIDGRSAAVQPANVLFISVQVPRGHHVVTLRYAPQSVVAGAATSGAGLIGLVALIVVAARVRPSGDRLAG